MDVVAYGPDEGGGWRPWQILLAVIAVVVVSIPLMLALWVGLGFLFAEGDMAKREQAKVEMVEVGKALNLYALGNGGSYPTDARDAATYLGRDLPLDPFTGGPFLYMRTSKGFELRSYGQDRRPGGVKADEDLLVTEMGLAR